MQGWRLVRLVVAVVISTAALMVLEVAVNVATGGSASELPIIERRPWWWSGGATVAAAGAGLLVWWTQQQYERGLQALVPAPQRPESWVIGRPAELTQIVRALQRRRGAATVGITTALHGAGGFGKTTIARLVRSDRRTLRRFGGRVYWVTLGRDARRGALVEKVNDLVRLIAPTRAQPFTDLRQAAEHLAAVLADGPRRLLILDDVWFEDQLAAFPVAGRCARLVTTRIQSLVAGESIPVRVDQMSFEQARQVLIADLAPTPPSAAVEKLLVETGRWPLLLRLVNRIMVDQARSRADVAAVAWDLLQQLQRHGVPHVVDNLTGAAVQQLDLADPDQRSKAVATTIEASAGLLNAEQYARFAELAMFAEDESIPVSLVALVWQRTGNLGEAASRALCARLDDLALLTLTPTSDGGTIGLHDVVRDYLHKRLGSVKIIGLHQTLLDAVSAELPRATSPYSGDDGQVVAWWHLPESARYMREHLIEHHLLADPRSDAETVAADLRWVQSRLEDAGPLGPFADLARIETPRGARLSRLLAQIGHLLAQTDPPHSLADILHSRVSHDPDWGQQARHLASQRKHPALTTAWPLPDLPDPALRRTLATGNGGGLAVAISPDGSWLTTADRQGEVRIWDATTGELRKRLTGHHRMVRAIAASPDASWLATADRNGEVRIWDATTGELRKRLTGHNTLRAIAASPDASWLATADRNGEVRIWDATTGELRKRLTGHHSAAEAVIGADPF